jgi:hypothetical protein
MSPLYEPAATVRIPAAMGLSARQRRGGLIGVALRASSDIDSKVVTIQGRQLSDDKLRAAIQEAGYEAA